MNRPWKKKVDFDILLKIRLFLLRNSGNFREIYIHALNLKDSGSKVIVGLYPGSKSAAKAKILQKTEDLSKIKISANDEVFDGSKPILTSVCSNSLFCPLLKKPDDRKTET